MAETNDSNRMGNNIRALCKAYGETQEELADFLTITDRALRYYLQGIRRIDDSTKEKIAKHYMVSVQELMYSDLSKYDLHFNIDNIHAASQAFYSQLPIIETDAALNDANFIKAYTAQNELYNNISKFNFTCNITQMGKKDVSFYDNWMELCNKYPDFLDCYIESYKIDEIKIESAVNYIALYHFISLQLIYLPCVLDKTAVVNAISKLIPSMDKIVDEIYKKPNDKFQEITQIIFPVGTKEHIEIKYKDKLTEMMKTISKSPQYADLAQYYSALEFMHNIVNNNMDWTINKRTGYDMLKQLAKLDNVYAERYLKFNPDPLE